jgi:hypothetical protein
VERGERAREVAQRRARQAVVLQDVRQESALGEGTHADHRVERGRARLRDAVGDRVRLRIEWLEGDPAVRRSHHGEDAEVERSAQAPVETHLVFAGAPPRLRGGEVGERESHRLLQLERVGRRDEDVREMRLQMSHRLGAVGIGRGIGERRDDLLAQPRGRLHELTRSVRATRSSGPRRTTDATARWEADRRNLVLDPTVGFVDNYFFWIVWR